MIDAFKISRNWSKKKAGYKNLLNFFFLIKALKARVWQHNFFSVQHPLVYLPLRHP